MSDWLYEHILSSYSHGGTLLLFEGLELFSRRVECRRHLLIILKVLFQGLFENRRCRFAYFSCFLLGST